MGDDMNSVELNLINKLNGLIDNELKKDEPDTQLISECVDGTLRLMPNESYQLTSAQYKNNIDKILSKNHTKRNASTFARVLVAAAIIAAMLALSVFAYTIIEYNINDYGTYSSVWANIFSKDVDKSITAKYIPSGYSFVENVELSFTSDAVYENENGDTIVISKNTSKSAEINTQFKKERVITVNNTDYIIFGEETLGKGVIWYANNYSYSIVANLPDEVLIEIAQNVR